MRLSLLAAMIVLLSALGPSFSEALEWEVNTFLFATEKPTGPDSSYVWARGLHQLEISRVRFADMLFPFRSRVSYGELFWEGIWVSNQVFFHECRTTLDQDPCESGIWHTTVTGRLEFHPKGGIKFKTSGPTVVNCACT